jgi:hypothetical protein
VLHESRETVFAVPQRLFRAALTSEGLPQILLGLLPECDFASELVELRVSAPNARVGRVSHAFRLGRDDEPKN